MERDEQFLEVIAYQARLAYATQQLEACQAARQLWQQRAEQDDMELGRTQARLHVGYYTRQVMRWQHYLAELDQAHEPAGLLGERP